MVRQIVVLLAMLTIAFMIPFGMTLYVGQVFMAFVYLATIVGGTAYALWQINRKESKGEAPSVADNAHMDEADALRQAEPAASRVRRSALQWFRIALALIALSAVGVFVGFKIAEALLPHRPSAGDRYDVAYEGEDECGNVAVRVDGLELVGLSDLDGPSVAPGRGSLVLDQVWDLPENDGLGASGILTLADGTTMQVRGGTEGKYFSNMACAIGG